MSMRTQQHKCNECGKPFMFSGTANDIFEGTDDLYYCPQCSGTKVRHRSKKTKDDCDSCYFRSDASPFYCESCPSKNVSGYCDLYTHIYTPVEWRDHMVAKYKEALLG